jgi:hypothetical protein
VRSLWFASVTLCFLGFGCRRQAALPAPGASTSRAPASAAASAGEFKPFDYASAARPGPAASALLLSHHRSPVTLAVSETDLKLPFGYGNMRTFSYESWAEWSFRHEMAAAGPVSDAGPTCAREIKVTPVAWITPLLGLREEIYQTCPQEAHPGGETRLTTLAIDLDRHSQGPPRAVLLTEIFDARVVYEALQHDDLVVKALHGSEIPTELDALVKALAEMSPVVDGKHCYSFPSDLLARFVLHHSDGTYVAARLGLPGTGPCRYELTEIELLLKMPEALKPALEHMGENTGSFFVADRPDQAKTAVVHVTARAPE